jgi:hypothetical protein
MLRTSTNIERARIITGRGAVKPKNCQFTIKIGKEKNKRKSVLP